MEMYSRDALLVRATPAGQMSKFPLPAQQPQPTNLPRESKKNIMIELFSRSKRLKDYVARIKKIILYPPLQIFHAIYLMSRTICCFFILISFIDANINIGGSLRKAHLFKHGLLYACSTLRIQYHCFYYVANSLVLFNNYYLLGHSITRVFNEVLKGKYLCNNINEENDNYPEYLNNR